MSEKELLLYKLRLAEKASEAYYLHDNPIMSDKDFDDLCDEIARLEEKTGIIYPGSPNHYVKGYLLDGLEKVHHSKPMLSAAKTKDPREIVKFIGMSGYYASYKLDGLTLVVKYKDGKLFQGITRGRDGIIGEDVTAQCRFIKNLPQTIPYKEELELRGEGVISWSEFERINSGLKEPYKHPRNLASGTIRNLDLNIVKDRNISFVVFEVVSDLGIDNKLDALLEVRKMGFATVTTSDESPENIETIIVEMKPDKTPYPVDGLIFELISRKESLSLGATSHHENCRMALKWKDDTYETTLRAIEWSTSKTGLVNPVAVFDPIDMDGAIVERATLHNISYIKELELGIGDTIEVYRANMVIPKVHDNLTRSNTWELPEKCPDCGGRVEIKKENDSETLVCLNEECPARLVGLLTHYCSKHATNIDGLSEQTIKKLVDLKLVKTPKDIYCLKNHKSRLLIMEGFGNKSVAKLFENIESSRKTTLEKFIYSLSIPLIGRSASKTLVNYIQSKNPNCSFDRLMEVLTNSPFSYWKNIEGFGDEMAKSIRNYALAHCNEMRELASNLIFETSQRNENASKKNILSGKTFVITGSVSHYKNRDELKNVIEDLGGKVSGSVSTKTSYLINNDKESGSSKNKKAVQLNVPIITEEEFRRLIDVEVQ